MAARYLYPVSGGAPKYYARDGSIYEMSGKEAFYTRGQEVYTLARKAAYRIQGKYLHRQDSGRPELFFGDD